MTKTTLRKTHKTYKIPVTNARGKQVLIDTGMANKQDALRVMRESAAPELIAIKRAAGQVTADVVSQLTHGRKLTMGKALPEFLRWVRIISPSRATYLNCETLVSRFIREHNLEGRAPLSIKEEEVDAFVNAPGQTKAGTRVNQLSILRKFFKFCAAKGYSFKNPAMLVNVRLGDLTQSQREPFKRQPFTDREIAMILEVADGFWRHATIIGLHTGLRLGDICNLEWSSIGRDKLTVWTDKRDRRVELPVTPQELRDTLAKIPKEDDRFCFPRMHNLVTDKSGTANASVQFCRLLKRLGIEGKSFHSLRHTYATRGKAAGWEMPHLAKSMGHQNEATTRGYVHE
jgi:integrase